MTTKYKDELFDDENDDSEDDDISSNGDEEEISTALKPKNIMIKTKQLEDDEEEDEEEDEDEDEEDEDDEDEDDEEKMDDLEQNRKTPQNIISTSHFEDEEDEDEEDEEDENYLQKFDNSIKEQLLLDYHPELKIQNFIEVEALSKIVRNENGVIIDPLHKTIPFITRYEKARILGERAKQINNGAKVFIEVDKNMIDGYLIALKEYEEKKIPFIIKRPIPNGGCEFWKFEDLEQL